MSNTRKAFVGGNWKCNGTQESIKKLIESFNAASVQTEKVDVVISPTFIHLPGVKASLRKDFEVAAQNCYTSTGAFTGEVSADLLKDFGVNWVILGHSERRQVFGETDALIGAKTAKALSLGLGVIACLGETLEQREQGKTLEVITSQLASFAKNVANWTDKFVIAYEPVWAIGTGKVATSQQAQEAHAALRQWIKDNVNAQVADQVRIIYGGSVKPEVSAELYSQNDIDGFLVGGASLLPSFVEIINACAK